MARLYTFGSNGSCEILACHDRRKPGETIRMIAFIDLRNKYTQAAFVQFCNTNVWTNTRMMYVYQSYSIR